jgi:transposase
MRSIDVSVQERVLLRQYGDSPYEIEKLRSQAVLLAVNGASMETICGFVDRSARTISVWFTDWRKFRMASIFSGNVGNLNSSAFTSDQRERILDVLKRSPEDAGLPAGFWTVGKLAFYCKSVFDVVYESDTAYYFLFKQAGLTFKYPQTSDRRRDEAMITERMEQVRSQVADLCADPDTVVLAADEVQVCAEALVRKAWMRKGEETVMKVDRCQDKQSYIGFLNQTTWKVDLIRMDWQNSLEVLKALDRLLRKYPGKRIVIVWDNASWHDSQLIRDQCGKGRMLERVHFIAMPPYAPDYNPIEHVWKDAKAATANIQRATFALTCSAFENYIGSRTFEYQI